MFIFNAGHMLLFLTLNVILQIEFKHAFYTSIFFRSSVPSHLAGQIIATVFRIPLVI